MLAIEIAGVDTFADTGETPGRERPVVGDLVERHTHLLGVQAGEFFLRQEPFEGRGRRVAFWIGFTVAVPVTHQPGQIGHRIAQCAQLPVEHACH